MKKAIQLAAAVAAVSAFTSLSSCKHLSCLRGSGHEVTENHTVTDFTKLELDGNYVVNLRQDNSLNVSLTGDDNLLKNVRIESSGSKLHIYNKRNVCDKTITLNIGIKNLEELTTSGATELKSQGKLNLHNFSMGFSGASKAELDLNADNVQTEGSGSSEIHLTGQAASSKIDISGSGDIYAFDFVTGTCEITTSGSGHCRVNALKTLKVSSSGAAEVEYKGNPSVSNDNSGSSTVTKVN